jgi:RNA polymerase sigma-70 factor, ECF subfamily
MVTVDERVFLSDLELVHRVTAGDMDAFELLYERHHDRVYGICLRMLANPTEAEDLTQESFVQTYRKLSSFRGESQFSTWLYRLVTNQVLMYFRKKNVKFERVTEEAEDLGLLVERQAFLGGKNRHPFIDSIAIGDAIALLPPGYRSVFVMHDVEGYEHEEIGRMLGVSVGTSKSQLHKARNKLRFLLTKKAPHRAQAGDSNFSLA